MIEICREKISLAFDDKSGFISSLKYEDKEYIGAEVPIFIIAMRDNEGALSRVSAFDLSCTLSKKTDSGFLCRYSNDNICVEISTDIKSEICWNINISGINDKVLEWVNYPQTAVKDDLKDNGGNSKILWGYNEGALIENMKDREKWNPYFEPEYPCKGIMGVYPAIVETQFMAYYNEISGMYLASHDKDDYLKGINLYRNDGGIMLEYRHFCGGEFGEGYKMPYPMVMKFFKGDWHDAAEIYKDWFKSLNKTEFVPIEKNNKLPKWYGESPVVVTYPVRGAHDTDEMKPNKLFPYINVMPHVERLEKAFGSKLMILLMHWEGTAPWAPPYVWPPFGGEDELKKLIDALHERGDVLGVYCSGIGWTINSNIYEYNTQKEFDEKNLKDYMCLSPEQTLPYSKICIAQRSGYDMCPSCDFTVDTVKTEVESMVNAGIDYIQLMDQNHGGTSYFCYSKKHNHPPVPGKWQVDAVKNMLKKAEENAGSVLFGCESAAAESYIPYLLFSDNRFNLSYRAGRPVPVYSYIYHEYLNNFMGNQVSSDWWIDYDKSPDAFYERIAYSFSAGDMLTAVIKENGDIDWNWGKQKDREVPDQKRTTEFIKNLNYWRMNEGKKYLHSGSMIKPLVVDCESFVIYRNDGSYTEVPEIHTSAWRASDGSIAQFLINYSNEEKECIVDISDNNYVLRYDDGNSEKINSGRQIIRIKPISAVMLEKKRR